MIMKTLKKIIYFVLIAGFAGSFYMGYELNEFKNQPINLPANQETAHFTIFSGNTMRQVAQKLADGGFISDPLMFIALAKFNGDESSIRAGEYLLKNQHTAQGLIELFRKGNSVLYSFTFIEGWSFKQLLAAIKNDPVLVQTINGPDVSEIMGEISFIDEHPEGRFFPDTYRFPRGTTDIDFLRRAFHTMDTILEEEWAGRAKNLPLKTPYEALILASIIEKETGAAFERPLISAAFIERLKKGMRLQTDPTIIYGLGDEYDGNIRYRDLRKDTPYNTYLHNGLTPTPIASPGRGAIHAALHPADSKAIYFVSKGDGTHQFSTTLKDHNKAVSKYQLKGRKPKRKAKSG